MSKKTNILWIVVSLLLIGFSGVPLRAQELKGTVILSGAWAIYPTAVAWAQTLNMGDPHPIFL